MDTRKVRVLYAIAAKAHGVECLSGDILDVEAEAAEALVSAGYAEYLDEEKPIEQATAAPGEKRRGPGRPRKDRSDEG